MWSLARLLDCIFPRHPLETLSVANFASHVTPAITARENDDGFWSLIPYTHHFIRDAIWELKYNNSTHAAQLIAHVLYPHLAEYCAERFVLTADDTIYLVPSPADPKRVRTRGRHHVDTLCRAIIREHTENIFQCTPLLQRTVSRPQQTTQPNKKEREKNVHNIMKADTSIPTNAFIVVVDDVISTGATMTECIRALRAAGYTHICGVSVAH